MSKVIIKIENVKKKYRLGLIGGGTLKGDIQSWIARKLGKEDPNSIIDENNGKQKKEFWALKGINLEIKEGERVGIIGINGAGKSTLLKLLSRVTAPTEGEIYVKGRITSMLEIGTGFHGELTGRENIYLNGSILGMKKEEIDSQIEDIIEFSECRQFIDTPVKRYSSGMYVKLAFAVAAHLNSEIMIMDEVLAVGDMAFQQKCLDKMSELSKNDGKTILYVSHNMGTIRRLCDRCIVLEKGRVVFDGNVENAIQRYLRIDDVMKIENVIDDSMRDKVLDNDMTSRVQLIGCDLLEQSSNYIESGDKFKFRATMKCYEDVGEVYLRCIVSRLDGVAAGTAMSQAIENCKKDDVKSIDFEFDSSQIAPGRYSMKIILFRPNNAGMHEKYDAVGNALVFEVITTKGQFFNYTWLIGWGSTAYPMLRII